MTEQMTKAKSEVTRYVSALKKHLMCCMHQYDANMFPYVHVLPEGVILGINDLSGFDLWIELGKYGNCR